MHYKGPLWTKISWQGSLRCCFGWLCRAVAYETLHMWCGEQCSECLVHCPNPNFGAWCVLRTYESAVAWQPGGLLTMKARVLQTDREKGPHPTFGFPFHSFTPWAKLCVHRFFSLNPTPRNEWNTETCYNSQWTCVLYDNNNHSATQKNPPNKPVAMNLMAKQLGKIRK